MPHTNSPRDVVIVEAVRTPIGRRNGGLSSLHSLDLLGAVQRELFVRTGVEPATVGQVVGGCVTQVGMQALNVTRTAWLAAGLPMEVASTTVDAQCGSSQQAAALAYALIAGGVVDTAVACGVEHMSRVKMGSTTRDTTVGKPINKNYWAHHEFTTQFEGAERIADQWGLTRVDCDEFGKLSQDRAALAWAEGRYDGQVVPLDAPVLGEDGKPTGDVLRVARDEGFRDTSLEILTGLKPSGRPDGVHTAGTSSQISDGASAILMMTRDRADAQGLTPMATIAQVCLLGCDPATMLTGPIAVTHKILADNKMVIDDIDVFEINEAFASVVLAWEREFAPDRGRVNPNGGAIALGHPLGSTGTTLVTKAVHEMHRGDSEQALVSMCCGGGLGTGTLLRRG